MVIYMRKFKAMLLIFTLMVSVAGCSKSYSNVPPQAVTPEVSDEDAIASQDNDGTEEKQLVPEEGAKLLIWEDSEAKVEYIKYVAEKFKETYGIEVEVSLVPDFSSRMIQDAPSYLGPDLLEAPHDQSGTLLSAGLLQPNDTTVDQIKKNFIKTVYDCLIYDDKVYGYPLTINTYALIYNKDIIGENGPETFQEIIDFAKDFNDPDENQYTIMWPINSPYYSHCILGGYGAYVFGKNGTDPSDIGLNTEAAIEGATYFKSLRSILNIKTADADGQVIDGLFVKGKLAYTINGLWSVMNYEKQGINVGVAPLPKLENNEYPVTFLGVQTLYVSAYTKYPNASKLFAEMATSEEMLKKRFELTREIPARTSLMDSDAVKADSIVAAFMLQAQRSTPMPSIPQMNLVWNPYMSALQSMWDIDTDPKEAMDTCAETIKSFIEMQK